MVEPESLGSSHDRLSKRSSLEELLFYKGQPSLFYPARLKKSNEDDFDYFEGRRLMLRGAFFPAKLVKTFSMAQCLCGSLLIIFGIVSIFVDASLSYLGGGIWGGALILTTGVIGILASRRPSKSVRIVAFLIFSLFGIATCGLVIVLCATGVASDVNAPDSFYVDDKGQPVLFLGQFSTLASAIACNGALLVLAIVSCLISLGSCVLSAREACQCYGSSSDSSFGPYAARRDRLLNWLGQQAVLNSLPPHGPQTPPRRPPWIEQQKCYNQRVKSPNRPERPSCKSRLAHLGPPQTTTTESSDSCESSPATRPRNEYNLAGSSAQPEQPPSPQVEVKAEYLAVDRKMAEDYIEKLLVDEKRFVDNMRACREIEEAQRNSLVEETIIGPRD